MMIATENKPDYINNKYGAFITLHSASSSGGTPVSVTGFSL